MARQRNTQIIGTFGPVICYKSGKDYLMRAKGKTGKQAPVAKKQASILGKASAISARLRAAFKPMVPDSGNRQLMYRLNNALQQWLRTDPAEQTGPLDNINSLKGFSFRGADYGDIFYSAMPVTRETSGSFSIHIPAFDSPNPIAPLPFRGNIQLQIMAACCSINAPYENRVVETVLDISYTGIPVPAQELSLSIQPAAGELSIVVVSVNKAAIGIVGAMWS